MITNVTSSSFQLDDELIDLNDLHTKAQLSGDGKIIHNLNISIAILQNVKTFAVKAGWDESDDKDRLLTIARKYWKKLKEDMADVNREMARSSARLNS